MEYIDKLAWIHIKNKQVLSTRSKGKKTYYIPGGKRENGEADREALTREIYEELNVRILPQSLQYIGLFEAQAHGKRPGTMVGMTCYFADYQGELRPSSEIEEIRWLKHSDRDKSSPVDVLILDWLKQEDLID